MEVEIGNVVVNDLTSVLSKWRSDFECLYKESKLKYNTLNEVLFFKTQMVNQNFFIDNNANDNLNFDILLSEVKHAIKLCKKNKSAGVDELPYEVYFNPLSELIGYYFLSLCFNHGMVPNEWNKSIIVPIPKGKSSNPRIPTSYRGISLLCTMAKIFSSVLNNRICKYLEQHELLADEQNGFRRNRACIYHLFVLTSIIRTRKLKSEPTFACYVDMRKAYDFLHRDSMFYKIASCGIRGKILRSIYNLYDKTVSCVRINDHMTKWFNVESGVKQGDTLSTTLFSLYINDLVKDIKETGLGITINNEIVATLLYADDIVILAENCEDLQNLIKVIHSWCAKWNMEVNIEKTKIVHYRKKNKPRSNFKFLYGNHILEITDHYKYLGCVLNEYLDFDITAKSYNVCEKLQNRAIRSYLGVHRYASKVVLNGDTGWIPDIVRRKLEIIRLWFRLGMMDNNRITKKIFLWDLSICKNNWSNDIKDIFKESGQMDVFNNRIDHNHFLCNLTISRAREYLMFQAKEKWKDLLFQQNKLRTYRIFKESCKCENYLLLNLPFNYISVLSQLRSGILPLHVETGRYVNKPVEERLCKFCDTGDVEDEKHFVFYCPAYLKQRLIFYSYVTSIYADFYTLEDTDKWKLFMEDKLIISKFAQLIFCSYQIRNQLLYK